MIEQNTKSEEAQISTKHKLKMALQISWEIWDYWDDLGTISEPTGEKMQSVSSFTPTLKMKERTQC